jgi:hypothetical protein
MAFCAATLRRLWLLLAKAMALALSASAKTKPPWQMPCELTWCASAVIDISAQPGPTASSRSPSHFIARSTAHIASATRSARSSGEKSGTKGSGRITLPP